MDRVGIVFLDRPSVAEQVKYAQLAERKKFECVWICETRLVRDAISVLGALAISTKNIKLGTGVINTWTRNAALTAMTFATLDEISKGRAILGLGAYWDPLAWKQGIERRKPLQAMREYIEVVRRLLKLETANFDGEIVKARDLKLDLGHGVPKKPKKVPIYIGATGLKMMELAGEIADGVLLNGFVSTDYTRKCIERIKVGAQRADRKLGSIDRPHIIACAMSKDGDKARDRSRELVTMYLGQQPHIGKASGIKEDLIDDINKTLGGWPPKEGGLKEAVKLVDASVVNVLTASGTPNECRKKVREFVEAGATCPAIMPIGENISEMINEFAGRHS